ncbi:MAG: AAA family ATPase [Sphingomonas sp.]|nr:AAA family ATPase [Sphingomonas sp.]
MSDRYVVLSGCSGGGKSTLLAELQQRGHSVVDEPGRRVVRAELQSGGKALPWLDARAFARRAIEIAVADRDAARGLPGWVFFDRGLVDAAVAVEHATGDPAVERLGRSHRYNATVFLTPPWPEIYVCDVERQHGLDDAIAEYERLERAYPRLGYRAVVLPKLRVSARADIVLAELEAAPR